MQIQEITTVFLIRLATYRIFEFGQRNKALTRIFLQQGGKPLQMLSTEFTPTETFV